MSQGKLGGSGGGGQGGGGDLMTLLFGNNYQSLFGGQQQSSPNVNPVAPGMPGRGADFTMPQMPQDMFGMMDNMAGPTMLQPQQPTDYGMPPGLGQQRPMQPQQRPMQPQQHPPQQRPMQPQQRPIQPPRRDPRLGAPPPTQSQMDSIAQRFGQKAVGAGEGAVNKAIGYIVKKMKKNTTID
jgi:hypothetical protein